MAAIDDRFEKNIMAAVSGHVESFAEVKKALQRLDREDHVLLHMRYMREFTDVQISLILSMEKSKVSEGLKKALENLKKIAVPSR